MEGELERNPLLARDDGEAEPEARAEEAAPAALSVEDTPGGAAETDLDARHDDLYADASPGDRATGDARPEQPPGDVGGAVDWSRAGSGGSFETDGEGFESALTRDKTLHEHLRDQLAVLPLPAVEQAVASFLIDAVDEGGYLRTEVDEAAGRLGCAQRPGGGRCSPSSRGSSRPGFSPATWPSAWACN